MEILSDLDNKTNAKIVKGGDVGNVPLTVLSFNALGGYEPFQLSNRVAIQLSPQRLRVYASDGLTFTEGEWNNPIPDYLTVEELIANESITLRNGKELKLGDTNLRSYNSTTLIVEADNVQFKNTLNYHLATLGTNGFDIDDKPILNCKNLLLSSEGNGGNYSDIKFSGAGTYFRVFDADAGIIANVGNQSYSSFQIFSASTQIYKFDQTEFNMLGKPIVNVSSGVDDNDAANVGQVNALADGIDSLETALAKRQGVDATASGGGSTLNIDGGQKNKWWDSGHKIWNIKMLQALSESHPRTTVIIMCTNYNNDTVINWTDKNGNPSNTTHLVTKINEGMGLSIYCDWGANKYAITYITREAFNSMQETAAQNANQLVNAIDCANRYPGVGCYIF